LASALNFVEATGANYDNCLRAPPNEAFDFMKCGLLSDKLSATHLKALISTDLTKLFLDFFLVEEKFDIKRGLRFSSD
jgi:hypothetical protein